MIVVMNVVQVEASDAERFEQAFASRERLLDQAEGFAGFELLRRAEGGEYAVISRWESHDAFQAWLKSDLFRQAHKYLRDGDAPSPHGSEVRTYEVLDTEIPA
jgi:heme-degrading monooxygenase HmoA